MRRVISRMILIILPVTLLAMSALAQTPRPPAPRNRQPARGLPTPSASAQTPGPAASAPRTETPAGPQSIYVSTTLPPTGHATLFRQYAATTQATPKLPKRRPAISPYLNLVPGGVANNYFLGVQRDQQIFDTGTQVQNLNTQVGGLERDLRSRRRPETTPRDSSEVYISPLKRKALEERSESVDGAAFVEQLRQLRTAQNESSTQQQAMLQAMLDELKAIRESLSPKKEMMDQDKGNN